MRRERERVRSSINKSDSSEEDVLQALYFDGRIDQPLYIETSEDGKKHRQIHQEDHLSLIQEPGSKYVGHVNPLSGKAIDIANAILEYVAEKNITLTELVCVGCDGCQANTRKHNSVIRVLEERLGRPLQWVVYQLHTNKLPLKHLFDHLDGGDHWSSWLQWPYQKRLA